MQNMTHLEGPRMPRIISLGADVKPARRAGPAPAPAAAAAAVIAS
jgi:hypothetical protein